MIRTVNEITPPANLTDYLTLNAANPKFALRRRTVLTRAQRNDWVLAISVVQAFPDAELRPESQPSHFYDRLRLLEDWLDLDEVQQFVASIQSGMIIFGDIALARSSGPNWQSEFVARPNNFMDRVGFVVQKQFEQQQVNLVQEPLISATEPYYPDDPSALQDWAQLTRHHGYNDGRNGHIVFLLPEARAYFTSAISDNGKLRLTLGGTDIGHAQFIVKGAFWQAGKQYHFGNDVTGDQIEFAVPNEVERLEYVLIDATARLYDMQREAWGNQSGLIRQRAQTVDGALVQRVRGALESGEGPTIEFKPFVDPLESPGSIREKTKLREILRTLAAFANTDGGTIFLGVQDDCLPDGIQGSLAKWGKAKIGEKLLARYSGTLTAKLRDHLLGDAHFSIAFVTIDETLVLALTVARFGKAPVGIKDDGHYYVRRGSNNVHLQPHEWPAVLDFGPSQSF